MLVYLPAAKGLYYDWSKEIRPKNRLKGYIAELEPKNRNGPSLARALFGLISTLLLPFITFTVLQVPKSNCQIEAYSGKINFDTLYNIRPFNFRLDDIFRPSDTLEIGQVFSTEFFSTNRPDPLQKWSCVAAMLLEPVVGRSGGNAATNMCLF
jgi:hypothetical protein